MTRLASMCITRTLTPTSGPLKPRPAPSTGSLRNTAWDRCRRSACPGWHTTGALHVRVSAAARRRGGPAAGRERLSVQPRVVDLAGGTSRRLTTGDTFGNFAAWSPDGTRIAFLSGHSGYSGVWSRSGNRLRHVRLHTMAPDGSDVRDLTDGTEVRELLLHPRSGRPTGSAWPSSPSRGSAWTGKPSRRCTPCGRTGRRSSG